MLRFDETSTHRLTFYKFKNVARPLGQLGVGTLRHQLCYTSYRPAGDAWKKGLESTCEVSSSIHVAPNLGSAHCDREVERNVLLFS